MALRAPGEPSVAPAGCQSTHSESPARHAHARHSGRLRPGPGPVRKRTCGFYGWWATIPPLPGTRLRPWVANDHASARCAGRFEARGVAAGAPGAARFHLWRGLEDSLIDRQSFSALA